MPIVRRHRAAALALPERQESAVERRRPSRKRQKFACARELSSSAQDLLSIDVAPFATALVDDVIDPGRSVPGLRSKAVEGFSGGQASERGRSAALRGARRSATAAPSPRSPPRRPGCGRSPHRKPFSNAPFIIALERRPSTAAAADLLMIGTGPPLVATRRHAAPPPPAKAALGLRSTYSKMPR